MRIKLLTLSAALATAGAVLAPNTAEACGGFFCSQSAPVVQTAERILFMQLDDNTIETHVQISYTGPSEDFAWIVPTPTEPELSLGSDVIFQALDQLGPPIEIIQGTTVGTCDQVPTADAAQSPDAASDAGTGGGGVNVVALETVGPFDTAIIQATAVEPMMEWLDTNGYDLPPQTAALLAPYVQGDMFFLALKLTKDASAGDLQPIAMTYNAAAPMIPIQLTAIAAQDDMPIQTWVIADRYAAPANYAEVEPNPIAMITNGWQVAAQRAVASLDERSMMRTYADEAAPIARFFYDSTYDSAAEQVRSLDAAGAIYDAIRFGNLGRLIQTTPLGLPALQFCAPVPEAVLEQGVAPRDFYNCPNCYVESQTEWTTPGGEACADYLDERLIEPLRRVAAYFEELRTASRFDTWLDADEMDLDPMFCWDDDGQARETLRATRTRYCQEGLYEWNSPVRWDIDGVTLFPNRSLVYTGLDDLSPIAQITRHGCGEGPTEVVSMRDDAARAAVQADAVESFDEWFVDVAPEDRPSFDVSITDPDGQGTGGGNEGARPRVTGGACSTGSAASAWPMLGGLLALLTTRRRRR